VEYCYDCCTTGYFGKYSIPSNNIFVIGFFYGMFGNEDRVILSDDKPIRHECVLLGSLGFLK
jgi:hypothetical protein